MRHRFGGIKRYLAIVGLIAGQFGVGAGTASASVACDAINALPPTGYPLEHSWPASDFAAGEYVVAEFTDNGTGPGPGMPGMGDVIFLNRYNRQNTYVYFAGQGAPGPKSLTAPTEHLMAYGLLVSNQNSRGQLSAATLRCMGAVAPVVMSPAAGALPGATYNVNYVQQFTSSGGTAPHQFMLATGQLPPGLIIASNGTLSGMPTATGSYTFTLKVVDSSPTPVEKTGTFSMAVMPAAPGTPTDALAAGQGNDVTVTFNAPAELGGTPITSYTVTAAPGGRQATGPASPITVTGLGYGTPYTFTVTAAHAGGTSTASAPSNAVTLRAQQALIVAAMGSQDWGTTPTLIAAASSGLPLTYTSDTPQTCAIDGNGTLAFAALGLCSITVSQPGNTAYEAAMPVTRTFTVQAVAPGAPVINSVVAGDASAEVSFTPSIVTGGALPIIYTVQSMPGNHVAAGTSSPLRVLGLENGVAHTFTVTATSGGGSAVSAPSTSVVPKGVQTISFPNPGNRDFGTGVTLSATVTSGLGIAFASSTPSVCTVGGNVLSAVAPGTCTITASQAGDNAWLAATPVVQSLTVIVPGGPVAVASTTLANGLAGRHYAATLSATGGALPYVWSAVGGLPAGFILARDGRLEGTTSAAGTYTVQVQVVDAAGQVSQQNVQLTIDAPTIVVTPASFAVARVGEAYGQGLSASGGNAPHRFDIVTGALPAGITLSTGGFITGTPTAAGAYPVTVRVTDAQGFEKQQAYTLVVDDQVPVGQADSASTGANVAVSIAVTANDAGPVTAIAIAQAPAHGTATVDGLTVVYTPARNYVGADSLTYTAIGPGGSSQTIPVSITVTAGALPVAVARQATLQAGASLTIDAAQGASNGPFTAATVTSKPASGSVEAKGTQLIYTAAPDASGTVSFSFTLSNAFGASEPVAVTLQVNPTPVAPSVTEAAVAGGSATVDVTAGATGGPFTAADVVSVQPATAGTARMARTAAGYALTFVASETFSGTARVSYTLSNVYATSATSVVSFAVQGRLDPSKDAEVVGILSAQADATRRMATGQINNFQRRLEQLHNGRPNAGFTNGITLTSASANRARAMRERDDDRPRGPNAINDPGASSSMLDEPDDVATAPRTASLPQSGASIWTGGAVNFGKADSLHGDASTDFTTSGLSMGADKQVADGLIVGAGVGYGYDDTDVGNSGSSSKVDSYSAAVYASYRPTDAFFIDSLLGYQWLSMDSVRSVTGTDSRVLGSRDGKQWFGSLSLGYIVRTRDIQLTPYGRIEAAQASLDGFTERGDAFQALSYQAQTVKTSTVSAGVLAQFAVKRDYGVWAPQLRAEYGRDLQGASNALMSYADLMGGNVYRANLLQQSRDHALLGTGLGLQTVGGWNFVTEYQIQLESNLGNNQSVRFSVEKKFDH